jgi:hypothetical protein
VMPPAANKALSSGIRGLRPLPWRRSGRSCRRQPVRFGNPRWNGSHCMRSMSEMQLGIKLPLRFQRGRWRLRAVTASRLNFCAGCG